VVLKRTRVSACIGVKGDGCTYVGKQFGWAATGPHGPRLGYGLVPLVMDGGESFDCEAFDGFYYRTNDLFYIIYPLRFKLTKCDIGLVGCDGYMELLFRHQSYRRSIGYQSV
jgi:hypothetical protein